MTSQYPPPPLPPSRRIFIEQMALNLFSVKCSTEQSRSRKMNSLSQSLAIFQKGIVGFLCMLHETNSMMCVPTYYYTNILTPSQKNIWLTLKKN